MNVSQRSYTGTFCIGKVRTNYKFTLIIYPPSILSQHSWPFPSSVFLKRFSRGPRTALSIGLRVQ
ncbi:hypothetical protein PSTT_15359 [Puccinia striiformis]|uniref:Uncharacterized protein n=1 Tax=Puccinia striiformis TaxID=27350 RepID=A0A2S4UHZ3_9BASI|nr:hypothetical protein PSTT_15359 [Puccinia striiformis]